MCGILGVCSWEESSVRPDVVGRMAKRLIHRGPDDEGMVFFRGDKALEMKTFSSPPAEGECFEGALGHRRLSIIDLSQAAHQPMSNEDGTVWIVYNGEIYNFQELKEGLEKKGHRFKSKSDTEVVIHAYEEWGVDCLQRFNGMFAFGIWDLHRRRLFLARDRFGEKPLVYYSKNGRFLFASEIKALLEDPAVEREVDISALQNYLSYQYVPSPDSIFSGIRKLPPAHYLICDSSGGVRLECYWRLHFGQNGENCQRQGEWCDLIRSELEKSVRLRLISDVPLGAFLSGGVDSSLVVGLMAKLSAKPVKTFSIGFEEEGFDELSYAQLISKYFGTEHHEFVVRPDIVEVLPKLVWHYNEPFADSSAIPTYYVAHMTKDFVKVVLTGDAGDENFAGYPRYLRSRWVALFTRIPEKLRKEWLPILLKKGASLHWKEEKLNRLADFTEVLSHDQGRNYAEQVRVLNSREKEQIYTNDVLQKLNRIDPMDYLTKKYEELERASLLDRLLCVDIHTYLPEDLLVKLDIATMANSIEARVPFLDHKFMELTARIPSELKLKNATAKYILKKAFSGFLPKTILQRRKKGFAVPISKWFRRELKGFIFDALLDHRTLDRGYFRKEGIERLLAEHVALHYDHSAKIWALLCLEIWFRVFFDGEQDFGLSGLQ